jgi:hypothetical protein
MGYRLEEGGRYGFWLHTNLPEGDLNLEDADISFRMDLFELENGLELASVDNSGNFREDVSWGEGRWLGPGKYLYLIKKKREASNRRPNSWLR